MEKCKIFLIGIKNLIKLFFIHINDNLWEIIFAVGFSMLFRGLWMYQPWIAWATCGTILTIMSCIGIVYSGSGD